MERMPMEYLIAGILVGAAGALFLQVLWRWMGRLVERDWLLDRAIVRRRMLEQPREDDYEQFMAERERLLEAANRRR